MEEKKQEEVKKKLHASVMEAYDNNEDEAKHAIAVVAQINKDLEGREKASIVHNGISYSKAYEYNVRKGINYAPPREPGKEREVSMGLVHEKIIGFCAFFLKMVYKRQVKCYGEDAKVIKGLGDIYDLAIEHSYRLEQFIKKLALIYWELFCQGDTFIQEVWDVRNIQNRIAMKDGQEITPDQMDYTYEFMDGLTYKDGEMVQVRKAISKILDGRTVILGSEEIEEIQDQPRITIEEVISTQDAKEIYGSLKRFKFVPEEKENIANCLNGEKVTLFDVDRLADPKAQKILHIVWDKEHNLFNILLNGIMLLPSKTTFNLFYPRGNYPITKVSGERMTGSARSRSVPAKTKFNADFVDWALKGLAEKFEQGIDPALLVHGKYTLSKDLFRAGQRTHGINKTDYEKADPDNAGITTSEFSFVTMLKSIVEAQTLSKTTSGEVSSETATAVNEAQASQAEKLGYLLDGVVNGFMDMALRRAETFESKYTIKERETIVDGKKIAVYQNFSVSIDGTDHNVSFDEGLRNEDVDQQAMKDKMFQTSFKETKEGNPTKYYLADPNFIRQGKHSIHIVIKPERVKDTMTQIMQMRDEFSFLKDMWGNGIDMAELKNEYIKITGRPDKIFLPAETMRLNNELEQMNANAPTPNDMGTFNKPTIKKALNTK
jgi:hypothetical protein